MTSEVNGASGARIAKRRREFAALLLAGAAGAGVVLLATRQPAAHVVVTPPRPLPRTVTPVSWQDLFPVVSALAVAALASMAAVLATRGWLRRITGLITAGLGVGIVALAAGRVTAAAVLAVVGHANLSPANGAGGGTSPGSTTAGGAGGAVGSLAGFGAHVELAGTGWRALILVGAALVIVVGIIIVIAATRLPAMSGRYERSAGSGVVGAVGTGAAAGTPEMAGPTAAARRDDGGSPPRRTRLSPRAGTAGGSWGSRPLRTPPATRASTVRAGQASGTTRAASITWEMLSAGSDPTAEPGDDTDL